MANPYESDDQVEVDLKDLLLEILAHWKIILIVMLLVGTIGFTVSKFLITPMYESTSKLYVLSKSTSITSLADIQTGTSLTNDYLVVVKDRPVLEQVIQNLGLEETYAELKENVTLNNPSNSRILQITVKDANPIRAKAIADEIAKVGSAFIAEKMDQDPPTIIQSGYADGKPVSPSVIKNSLIGAVAGALFVVALIVITYLFNDTIATPEDIEKKLGMNVLGSLPLEASEDDGEKTKTKKRKRAKKGKK